MPTPSLPAAAGDASNDSALVMARLRREWLITAELFGVATVLMFLLLRSQWATATVLRWAAVAVVVQAETLRVLWRNLAQHHRPGETSLLPGLGAGTALTLLRGCLVGLLAGFLLTPWPTGLLAWLPALLYTTVAVADHFDGYLARRSGSATRLGEALDMELDGLGMLVVVGVAIHFGQLPLVFALIGLARYVFLLGVAILQRLGRPVYDLTPSRTRRILASVLMVFMSIVLWPVAPPDLAVVAGAVIGIPLLAGFLRDWLVVSGAVDPESPRYQALRRTGGRLVIWQAPVVVRFVGAAAALVLTGKLALDFATAVAGFDAFGLPLPGLVTVLVVLLALAAAAMFAAGAAGRLGAILLVTSATLTTMAQGPWMAATLAVAASLYVLMFGTGAYSLWRPEDGWFYHRAGEASPGRPDEH